MNQREAGWKDVQEEGNRQKLCLWSKHLYDSKKRGGAGRCTASYRQNYVKKMTWEAIQRPNDKDPVSHSKPACVCVCVLDFVLSCFQFIRDAVIFSRVDSDFTQSSCCMKPFILK